jgi:hemin uptake protein HemP
MTHSPNKATFQTAQSVPPVHDVYSLTAGGALAQIVLEGKTYQLRITRAGKLILTK